MNLKKLAKMKQRYGLLRPLVSLFLTFIWEMSSQNDEAALGCKS